MELIIKDNMKKEAAVQKKLLIILSIFTILIVIPVQILYIVDKNLFLSDMDTSSDVVHYAVISLRLFIVANIMSLYSWLYGIKYNVEIRESRIDLKTLFKELTVDLKQVTKYKYKKYGLTAIFQFTLYTGKNKIVINTRFKDEMNQVLDNLGITT